MNGLYYCTENNKVFTLYEIYIDFLNFQKEDKSLRDSSFDDYMNDCTSKNGSLRRVNPKTMLYDFIENEVVFISELEFDYATDDSLQEKFHSSDEYIRDCLDTLGFLVRF